MATLDYAAIRLYCLNNPFAYFDPNGRFAFAVPFVNITYEVGTAISCPIWGTGILVVAGGAAVGYASYKDLNHSWDEHQREAFEKQLADMDIYPEQMDKRGEKKGSTDPKLTENPDDLKKKP